MNTIDGRLISIVAIPTICVTYCLGWRIISTIPTSEIPITVVVPEKSDIRPMNPVSPALIGSLS
ncbi:hypothetical protein [Haloarcula argentinensis]|uniref:Uncharacterized protein n=1 Tax=Haloarcula argentinensis TaxID=43776 RepID=A0ABU2F5L3_HALAR|nr:hypothetical protein [Haloarcula argentinensis]MDS0255766.1 hypothetical protein [Haloarcula argentinensis]